MTSAPAAADEPCSRPCSLSHPPALHPSPLDPQDPNLEGERVLHDLETLPPLQLFDQLVALGLAASMQLLGTCQGASLAPVQDLVHKYIR